MKKLFINLQNCYGINKLNHEFDFIVEKDGKEIKNNTFIIYAPNGVMKTSFTKVFKKFQSGTKKDLEDIKDHIYDKENLKEIKIDNQNIDSNSIFVINSFESLYSSDKMADLLIDKESKDQLEDVFEARNNLFGFLTNKSGIKKELLEEQIKQDFSIKSFLQNLNSDIFNLNNIENDIFSNIVYAQIFDETVLKKIKSNEFQEKITEFLNKSDEIYSQYSYLKKGEFSLGKLKEIQKGLTANSFFVKENKIVLKGDNDENIISNLDDLEKTIGLIERSLQDTKEFKAIEKTLSDAKGRILKDIIEKTPEIINELKLQNIDKLRKKLWLSYIKDNEDIFQNLKNKYIVFSENTNLKSFDDTPWKEAYKIFKERFTVPFEMEISNKESSILGESLPKVIFKFWDKDNKKWIEKDRDRIEGDILSQGEKRSLYLLNIIFDIEVRKKLSIETLFIIDDIADSFDYKNKYAIVEYLNDISKENNFYQIILTHNFDFFRTIQERILDSNKWNNSYIAQKNNEKIALIKAGSKNITNPFDNWKKTLNNNKKSLISAIPFIRNLVEYKDGNKSLNYLWLTHLLHQKQEVVEEGSIVKSTLEIRVSDLENIFSQVLKNIKFEYSEEEKKKPVIDLIYELSDLIINETITDEILLENKIILAIGIRLKAEEYMQNKISNKSPIKGNQTGKLYQRYKDEFKNNKSEKEKLRILESINIMTPENIHINSFMYEPILDMGINELVNLYKKIK